MRRAILTTSWDDGNVADLRVAELLERHGLRGTFYVPRRFDLPVLSAAQMRQLAAAGHEIGAHTLDHVVLTRLDDAAARMQIAASRDWVSRQTGEACTMFCPPLGRFAARHRAMIAEAGFTGFRTIEGWSLDWPRPGAGVLEMPTSLQAFAHGLAPQVKNLLKRGAAIGLGRLVRAYRGDWVAAALRLAREAVRVGGVFHLWGHSWEIERFALWPDLQRVCAGLGELLGHAEARTNGRICAALGDQRAGCGGTASRSSPPSNVPRSSQNGGIEPLSCSRPDSRHA